jgi:hypothetical protein
MISSLRPGARYFLTFCIYIGIFRGMGGKRKREKGIEALRLRLGELFMAYYL